MRRMLLKSSAAAWPSVAGSIGSPWAANQNMGGAVCMVVLCNSSSLAATAKTTITSVTGNFMAVSQADTGVTFTSGTISGTTYTVRDVSALVNLTTGAAIKSWAGLALKVNVGDYLGIHLPRRSAQLGATTGNGGDAVYTNSVIARPTPGQVITLDFTLAGWAVTLKGTNP